MTKPPALPRSNHRYAFNLVWIALLLATSLLLSACSGLTQLRSMWGGNSPAPPPVELTAWLPTQSDEEATLLAAQIERATKVDGGAPITVTLMGADRRGLDRILRSADPPDLFEMDLYRLPALVEDGRLAPLPADFTLGGTYIPSLVDAATVDGRAYCLPKDANILGLYFNKDLFEAADIAYATENWNWEDLAAAAEAISGLPTVKFTAFGLVLDDDISRWLPFLLQAGGQWGEGGVAPTRESVGQAITFYDALLSDGYAIPSDYYGSSWSGPDFGNGRVGMVLEGNWLAPYLATEFPSIRYGVAPLPAGPGGEGTLVFGTCYAVSADSPHKDEAFAVIEELATETAMREWLAVSPSLPARNSLLADWERDYPQLRPLLTQLDQATVWQTSDGTGLLVSKLRSLLQDVLAGELTVEEALEIYDDGVQAIGE